MAALFTAITALFVWLLRKEDIRWGMMLLLAWALMIYPNPGSHYSVVLILPILYLWQHRQEVPGGMWGSIVFLTFVYAVINFDWGNLTFLAYLMCWMMYAVVCSRILLGSRVQTRQAVLSQAN